MKNPSAGKPDKKQVKNLLVSHLAVMIMKKKEEMRKAGLNTTSPADQPDSKINPTDD